MSVAGNACILVSSGAKAPSSGKFYGFVDMSQSQKVEAGNTVMYGMTGLFCPTCSGASCNHSRCHDVEHQYMATSDGTLTVDGVEKPVIRGQRTSSGGRFCPQCKDTAIGYVAESAGAFLSEDRTIYVDDVPAGMQAPVAGMFCFGKAPKPIKANQLVITPSWTNFASFNEAKGVLSGSMAVEYQWFWMGSKGYADGRISEPHLSVNLENFASGASGRVVSGLYQDKPLADLDLSFRRIVVTYVGDFQQKLDGTCYPWDEQNISFDFRLPWPYSTMVEFIVRCTGYDDNCDQGYICAEHEKDTFGNCLPDHLRTVKNVRFEGSTAKQFRWSALQCEKVSTDRVVCSMRGTRVFSKDLLMHLGPGVLLSVIGFGSFLIPHNMAMPRVATTMIALLTFVNKGSVVVRVMPSVGLNIVEEFYIWGMVVMMVNMIGHILSWKKPGLAALVNELQLGFVLLAFILFAICSIYNRGCANTSASGLVLSIVGVTLMLLFSLVWSIRRHREDLANAYAKAKKSKTVMKLRKDRVCNVDDDDDVEKFEIPTSS
eukprot:TRINITY_DN5372_c0_g4_i1.p1 TRINITY_DN5372_c0_g4~~TRINITY_DN5372_c0_g4_i1.p1  ORF type:complete len:575 (+),score=40.75 TRINITY_DN5372_c0_g4_i1:94-1725(+)